MFAQILVCVTSGAVARTTARVNTAQIRKRDDGRARVGTRPPPRFPGSPDPYTWDGPHLAMTQGGRAEAVI
jgi:hypothetical protein